MTPSEFISADVRRKKADQDTSGHSDGKEAAGIFGADLLRDEVFMDFILTGARFAQGGAMNAFVVAMAWIHLGYMAAMATLAERGAGNGQQSDVATS